MRLYSEMRSKCIFWEDIISKDTKAYLFFIDMTMTIENGFRSKVKDSHQSYLLVFIL